MKFLTDSVNCKTDGKDYYIEGYISTPELDQGNDMITVECLDDMVTQLNEGSIKIDVEHNTFKGDNDVAIGRVVSAYRDEHGIKVNVLMNKAHHRFDEIWKSVKNGFLDAFSIAYDIIDWDEVNENA